MIHYLLREIGAGAALSALRRLAAENAHRGFDPWAGAPLVPQLYSCAPPVADLIPTAATMTTADLAALLSTVEV